MTGNPMELPHRWRGSTLREAVTNALSTLVAPAGQGSTGDETFALVFSGEAGNPELAFRAAFDDLIVQCADHHGTPRDVEVDGLMDTDEGTRIWGTVHCAPAGDRPWQEPKLSAITIQREGDDRWTLTIVRA